MSSYYTIENWTSYTLSAPNSIVRASYNQAVFCSPGQVTGGEGQSGGGEE
ncbi:MAG: hypothetical protein HPY53_13735 [Brevinematales bacterium]|nr:hypothetical protein [Brevinematales bacterium]